MPPLYILSNIMLFNSDAYLRLKVHITPCQKNLIQLLYFYIYAEITPCHSIDQTLTK